MTAQVAHITRHPIKSIGWEDIERTTLTEGCWLPLDRVWAVSHERSKLESNGWAKKANFLRGVTDPSLMAIRAKTEGRQITLSHPDAPDLTFDPDSDGAAFLDWIGPLWSSELPAPTGLYRASNAHLTDVPDPWVSINTLASLKVVSQRAGHSLSRHRWRGNIWVEGTAPWEEFDWIGENLTIGSAVFEVIEPITRCKATMANPDTGRRDTDTLGILNDLGHQEFGVYARVIKSGDIAIGDPVT